MKNSVLAAVFAAALSTPLAAQDDKQDPPVPPVKQDPPAFDDLKNSLGELQEKQAKEDQEKRDRQIQKNYEEALKIYGSVSAGKGADLANVTKRLQANQALEQKYAKLLEQATADLATMRAQYINRTMNLKKGLDEGKLSRDSYDKLLEDDTKKFRNREKELIEDIAFFNEEISNSRKLQKELLVKKELLSFDPFDPGKKEEPAPAGPRPGIAESLKKTVSELSGYSNKSVLDLLR